MVQRGERALADTDQPHEIIEVGASPAAKPAGEFPPWYREIAEYLRYPAGKKAARHVHLPEPLLGVQVTLSKKQIMLVGGEQVRDAVVFPVYFNSVVEAGKG